jgi:rhomboid family GlyGly-CTERM serine protease
MDSPPDPEPSLPLPRDARGGVAPSPWIAAPLLAAAVAALLFQCVPAWRGALLYDRAGIANGEFWRVWTGHLVHFGWPHFVVDTGLLLIVGFIAGRRHPRFMNLGLLLMPAFISGCLYWLEPSMTRYGGLSAVNLGLLLYVAVEGWRAERREWFWPAVLAAYVAELAYESIRGGQGGGTIRFDEPDVRVATGAHLAAVAYALLALAVAHIQRSRQ